MRQTIDYIKSGGQHVAIVFLCLYLFTLALTLAGTLVGGYYITKGTIHHAQQVQLQAAKGTCLALKEMNDAGTKARFPSHEVAGVPTKEQYGHLLATAIHDLYKQSQCASILNGTYKPPG